MTKLDYFIMNRKIGVLLGFGKINSSKRLKDDLFHKMAVEVLKNYQKSFDEVNPKWISITDTYTYLYENMDIDFDNMYEVCMLVVNDLKKEGFQPIDEDGTIIGDDC